MSRLCLECDKAAGGSGRAADPRQPTQWESTSPCLLTLTMMSVRTMLDVQWLPCGALAVDVAGDVRPGRLAAWPGELAGAGSGGAPGLARTAAEMVSALTVGTGLVLVVAQGAVPQHVYASYTCEACVCSGRCYGERVPPSDKHTLPYTWP